MENDTITKFNDTPNTEQTLERKAETNFTPSQLMLYRNLPTNCSVSTMVAAQSPTIAKIKNSISLNDIRALLSIAICEVCDFFNISKNMNNAQIAITVDLIIENFWYLKLEEVKYCFHRAMMRERIYDRLDGNIIIGWLRDYDAERTEEAMRMSDQRASQELNEPKNGPGAVSFKEYMAILKEQAQTDKEAAKRLEDITEISSDKTPTQEKVKQKNHDFETWKQFNYLLKREKR